MRSINILFAKSNHSWVMFFFSMAVSVWDEIKKLCVPA